MKVITIKQPFATLIAEGLKEYEFRTWPTKMRGDILIHADKGVDKVAMKRYEHLNLEYPLGCIIAQAKLSDCVEIDDKMIKVLKDKNPLVYYGMIHKTDDKKYYGFKLENVQKIDSIKINGQLGFWNYE